MAGGTLVTRNLDRVDHRYACAGNGRKPRLTEPRAEPLVVGPYRRPQRRPDEAALPSTVSASCSPRTRTGITPSRIGVHHRGGSLAAGVVIGGTVQCLWHGSQFDVSTGTGHLRTREEGDSPLRDEEKPNGRSFSFRHRDDVFGAVRLREAHHFDVDQAGAFAAAIDSDSLIVAPALRADQPDRPRGFDARNQGSRRVRSAVEPRRPRRSMSSSTAPELFTIAAPQDLDLIDEHRIVDVDHGDPHAFLDAELLKTRGRAADPGGPLLGGVAQISKTAWRPPKVTNSWPSRAWISWIPSADQESRVAAKQNLVLLQDARCLGSCPSRVSCTPRRIPCIPPSER